MKGKRAETVFGERAGVTTERKEGEPEGRQKKRKAWRQRRIKEGKGFGRKEIREESGGMIARGICGEKEAIAKRMHGVGG